MYLGYLEYFLTRNLPDFKEKNVISKGERRSSGGKFVPLYDLKKRGIDLGIISRVDSRSRDMLALSDVWFNGSADLYMCRSSKAIDFVNSKYPEYVDFSNIVALYCIRHSLELSMKAYLMLCLGDEYNSVKVSNSFLKNFHSLIKLFDYKDYILFAFRFWDKENNICNSEKVRDFIHWYSDFEFSNENSYRYPLDGVDNQLQSGNIYVNFDNVREYVFYFLNVIKFVSARYDDIK